MDKIRFFYHEDNGAQIKIGSVSYPSSRGMDDPYLTYYSVSSYSLAICGVSNHVLATHGVFSHSLATHRVFVHGLIDHGVSSHSIGNSSLCNGGRVHV